MPAREYKYVMRCAHHTGKVRSLAFDDQRPNHVGDYLQAYDPEFMNGEGLATWTKDPSRAFLFPTKMSAMQMWKTIPRSKPVRADGEPNRPLTAYSIEVIPIDEAVAEFKEAQRARRRSKNSDAS